MLFLNQTVIRGMDQGIIQEAVKEAYRLMLSQNYNMPDRMHVADRGNTLLLMPSFAGPYFATKLVSVFPDAKAHGLPSVNGILILCDNRSGQPLALLDAASLTAQRTGAVGGLAVRALTPATIRTAGIFGTGVQGMAQAGFLLFNRDIDTLYLSGHRPEAAEDMARILTARFPGTECRIEKNPEKLVEQSEVIIAATTSPEPVFKGSPELVKNKIFISIGSFRPDMQELPDAVVQAAGKVWVDTPFAAEESGDLAGPIERNLLSLEGVVPFSNMGEDDSPEQEQTVFFKSVGMALFDLTVSTAIYLQAKENGLGQMIDMGG